MINLEDTICAPATAVRGGAISVIRVSGPDALKYADTIISFRNGAALSSEGYTLKYGSIKDLDDVVVGIFRAPHSYTGEDSVEISCHASPYVVSKILRMLVDAGCRMAEPGEFSRRAFVAGKMDLAQAEAVADIIASDSAVSHRVALNQLKGGYSKELKELRSKLMEIASLMELELDFSEEDVEFADRAQLQNLLDSAMSKIEKLIASFSAGNAIRNGVPVAIVGAVNAGKSTLLNALLGEERAIVSDIPGTTRDTVEETLNIDGVLFRFIDTAGIRESADQIERIGIKRSFESIAKAETVIGMLDGTEPAEEAEKACTAIVAKVPADKTLIMVRNKVDLYDAIAPEEFPTVDRSYKVFPLKYPAFGTYDLDPEALAGRLKAYMQEQGVAVPEDFTVLDISARTGEGMDELRRRLVSSRAADTAAWGNATMVTNLRHYEALERALDDLRQVSLGLDRKTPTDLVAQDLRSAIHELGTIFGAVTTDDLLDNVFSRFCIGK